MMEEFLQQMVGNTPINAVPANGSLGKEKFVQKSISPFVTDFLVTGKNLFNTDTVTSGQWINFTNGNVEVSASYSYSDYIPVKPSTQYSRKYGNYSAYFYDSSFNKISGISNVGATFTTPVNAAFMRINIATSLMDTEQIEEGSASTAYENFYLSFKFPYFDTTIKRDTFPFQTLATGMNGETAIRIAVKQINLYGADPNKKYCLGIIQRNFSTYGTGAYIYECDLNGNGTTIVAMTSITAYVEPKRGRFV